MNRASEGFAEDTTHLCVHAKTHMGAVNGAESSKADFVHGESMGHTSGGLDTKFLFHQRSHHFLLLGPQ